MAENTKKILVVVYVYDGVIDGIRAFDTFEEAAKYTDEIVDSCGILDYVKEHAKDGEFEDHSAGIDLYYLHTENDIAFYFDDGRHTNEIVRQVIDI